MDKAGVSDVSALSKAKKQELLGIAQEAASVVGAKINYTKGSGITVIAEDGKIFGTYVTDAKARGVFVQTGYNYAQYILIGGLAIIAIAGTVIIKRNRVNA